MNFLRRFWLPLLFIGPTLLGVAVGIINYFTFPYGLLVFAALLAIIGVITAAAGFIVMVVGSNQSYKPTNIVVKDDPLAVFREEYRHRNYQDGKY